MTNRPFLQPVALAGAVAISASLIGFAALQQTSPPSQTRAVVLTAGDAEIFLPDLSTFTPTVAEGFPPVEEVLQGAEQWSLINSPGVVVNLDGNDTQTTIGSFVNNDFLERGGVEGGAGAGVPLPASGSEIDLMSFGGGYESEWANLVDENGGHTITDTIITPFGDYTIPLGSTPPPPESDVVSVAAAVPAAAYSFTDLVTSIQNTVSAGEGWFTSADTAFTHGEYPLALSEELAGFNNLTVGVGNDLLTNGYAALTGDGGNAGYALENPPQPQDFATALAEFQTSLTSIQQDFAGAFTEFASGQTYFGLIDLGQVGVDSTSGTDAIILGVFDSIPGMVFTS